MVSYWAALLKFYLFVLSAVMDTPKNCVSMTALTLCILRIEAYFGSPAPQAEPQADAGFSSGFGSAAPQAEPQADAGFSSGFGSAAPQDDMALVPANAATFSRLLMIVTSLIVCLIF